MKTLKVEEEYVYDIYFKSTIIKKVIMFIVVNKAFFDENLNVAVQSILNHS